MAHFIAASFSHSEISSLFFACSVPDDFLVGDNKLQRALGVLRNLAASDLPQHIRCFDDIFEEVLQRKGKLLKEDPNTGWGFNYISDVAKRLKRALQADGFEICEGEIVPIDRLEKDLVPETNILYSRLRDFAMSDVCDTLEQAHENFVAGNYESCNAMLRTALESTLQHAARCIAGSLDNIPRSNPNYLSPMDVRKHLENEGFFTQDEMNYIKSFYSYASTSGSHPGISNQAESRLRRLMIISLIQYCMEKLEFKKTV